MDGLAIEIDSMVRDKGVHAVGICEVFNLKDTKGDERQIIMQHIVKKPNSSAAQPEWTGRSDGHYIFVWNSSKLLLIKYAYVSCGVEDHAWRMAQYFQFHRAELQNDSPLHLCHNHSPSSHPNAILTDDRRKIIFATLWNYVLRQDPSESPLPVTIFAGDFNCHHLQWTQCLQRANFTQSSRRNVQMCISKEDPLHGDQALVFNAYAAQQTSTWGKSFPRADQAKPFSDGHDVVLVPVCWNHLHSPSSAALTSPPSMNPLAASDILGSAALPALQSMTPLTVPRAAPVLGSAAYTQRGLQPASSSHAASSSQPASSSGYVTEPAMTASAAAQPLRNTQTTPSLSTKPAFRCGVCKQVWNVGSMMPHNGIHCGKELEDLTDIPHPLFLAYRPATELPAASSGHATEQPASAEQQWRALHGRIVTLEFAAAVPQIDRISKQEALRTLQTLCMGPLPTDAHAAFKWWLFVSNLGNKTDRIIGPGIVSAALEDQWDNGVMLLFERQDGTKVKLEIQQPRRGSCSTRIL